jgi:uncharacterized protein with ParB-like and HNH nuclease domain
MKAAEISLLEFFKQPMQLIVPNTNRHYRWTAKQCRKLWDDIVRVGEDESVTSYFIGTILYVEYGILARAHVPRLILLDGQQRLVTISLLLAVLGKADDSAGQKGAKYKKINDLFLFNNQEKGEFYHKLVPTQYDRDIFYRLIRDEGLPSSSQGKLIKNYHFFENAASECGMDTASLYRGIAKLTIMDISTDRFYENPRLVYESLNSTGLDTAQTKLITNWLGLLRSAS